MKTHMSISGCRRGLLAIAVFCLSAPAVLFTGCLNYAYNYEYVHSEPSAVFTGTAYEFIKSRSEDKFSLWYEAIEAADMKDFYEEPGHTYFLLEDDQLAAWLSSWHYSSVSAMPQTALTTLLGGYTLPKAYNSAQLTTSPIDVLSCDSDHVVRMRLYPNASTASQNLHAMSAGWVNYDGSIDYRGITTSNIEVSNGYIHVVTSRFVRK